LLVNAGYKIKAFEDKQGVLDSQFIDECFNDMTFTFSDFMDEILTMLEMGFSYFETVYKMRLKENSKYNDGKIGWRKFAIRPQEKLYDWNVDEYGGIKGVKQKIGDKEIYLPIEKCLLFRTTTRLNKQEGKSLLRGSYVSWFYKKNIEKYEAIGIERDLAGLPMAKIPSSVMNDSSQYSEWKKVVSNIKNDEQLGIVIPSDTKDGQPLYQFELLSSSGSKNFDTDKIITRYDSRIAMSLSADFMLLGQGNTGSWALSTDKTDMFQLSLNAIVKKIEEVINKYAIPRLFEINGMERKQYPELVFDNIAKKDIKSISELINNLSSAGMPIFPNPEIEEQILKMMGFETNVQ